MRKFQVIILFLLFSCSEDREELLKGPFIIDNNIKYDQETRKPITGRTSLYEGSQRIEGVYLNGLKHGPFTSYEGEEKIRIFTTNYQHGLEHGERKEYYTTGQLMRREHYKEGVLNGPYEFFHQNGQLNIRTFYSNGKRHGEYVHYDDKGRLKTKGQIIEGKRQGYWLEKDITFNFFDINDDGEEGWKRGSGEYNKGVRKGSEFPDQD